MKQTRFTENQIIAILKRRRSRRPGQRDLPKTRDLGCRL